MKNYKITVIILMTLISQIGYGQVTEDDNVPVVGRYLGFDNFSTIDLPLENNGVRTVFSFENWPGYNSIAAQNNANRIYFPTDPSETQADIFSLIQIGDGINSNFQRDWMHVGITYGAGGDLMYTGIIQDPANAGNQTGGDAVVVWGDNETVGTQGPDNLRFIFMSAINPNNPGAGDDQGLETMRISPQGNVGLGNFSAGNGLAEQPTERLDIDGGARIRQLPSNDTPDVIITGSEADAVGDYLLTYSTINDLAGIDCRWKDIPHPQ